MDLALRQAATKGDVKYLKEVESLRGCDYFLTQFHEETRDDCARGNIFHLAIWEDKLDFFREVMEMLPVEHKKRLLSQEDQNSFTPLHVAADLDGRNSHEIVKIIIDFGKSLSSIEEKKLWLAVTRGGSTPLHLAFKDDKAKEKCAMEILEADVELLSSMVDEHGNSPLFLAMQFGYSQVAETILMLPPMSSFSVSGEQGSTPLHFAPYCSERVLKLLLEKCEDCINKVDEKGYTALHRWAKIGKIWPCELLLRSEFREAKAIFFRTLLFCKENEKGDTPLHMAARNKDSEIGQVMVRGYQQIIKEINEGKTEDQQLIVKIEDLPWRTKNTTSNIALHVALYPQSRHELALELLSIDSTMSQIRNGKGESPLFLAVLSVCEQAVDEILKIQEQSFDMLCRNDGSTILHYLYSWPGRKLLEKYWWITDLRNDSGRNALDKAKNYNSFWLVNLLKNPSLIQKQDFDWKAACERQDRKSVENFINHCRICSYDLQNACRKDNDTDKDTLLHHLKQLTFDEYQHFLKIPSIGALKNTTDRNGATPLHQALERKDMIFAKALLLDDGVERFIPNSNNKTAMDLLAKLYNENDQWMEMCKEIKVNPYLKTSYIQPGTNLEQMRNTLSVVAALLATITFAAGFTLPDGINSNTGKAILAKKVAFLVFLLAYVFAMCTSMLVLFCLIWSMVSEPNMARILLDRSVFILMQSLYGMLLAFMTGIYAVIADSSLWAAILIFVVCSIIGISANRTILHKVITKLVPAANYRGLGGPFWCIDIGE